MTENRNRLPFVFDSAEPFGHESFDPELTADGLTADGLVAGCHLFSVLCPL
jgi:hypothetical protein